MNILAGHQPFQGRVDSGSVFFEECWKVHQVASSPGRAVWRRPLRLFLGFGIKRLSGRLAAGFLEQDFHFALCLLQVFLAVS
jgi:hypothetical protein